MGEEEEMDVSDKQELRKLGQDEKTRGEKYEEA